MPEAKYKWLSQLMSRDLPYIVVIHQVSPALAIHQTLNMEYTSTALYHSESLYPVHSMS